MLKCVCICHMQCVCVFVCLCSVCVDWYYCMYVGEVVIVCLQFITET